MVSCSNVVRSLVICCLLGCLARIGAFSTQPRTPTAGASCTSFSFHGTLWCSASDKAASNIAGGPKEIVARRILVTGDVQGGYLRACILNEAGRFRRLVGTMTPPEEGDSAEIYVEGKRKVVDGFIRWCKKADIGLSQTMNVIEVLEEEPTGLYDAFYVKTK